MVTISFRIDRTRVSRLLTGYRDVPPANRQAIVDTPELMDPAIEEMLRQQTPVMMVPRVMKKPKHWRPA